MGPPPTVSTSPKINKLFRRNSQTVTSSQAPVQPHASSSTDHPPSSFVNPDGGSSSHHGFRKLLRKSSKILVPDKAPSSDDDGLLVETPVIVEPPSNPFQSQSSPDPSPELQSQPIPRTIGRSQTRPLTMTFASTYDPTSYGVSPSTARFSEISSRFSGWFNQNFTGGSVTDLPSSLTTPITTTAPPLSRSPTHKASALLNARKVGGPVVDKVVRYFLDSDSQPDKCTDPIWLMGVKHPGYEPNQTPPAPVPTSRSNHRRESTEIANQRSTPPTISRGSIPAYHKNPSLQSLSLSASSPPQVIGWPPAFYEDFTSCIWMTYRSNIVPPLRDITLSELDKAPDIALATSSPAGRKWWPVGREKEWSSDGGWGCMLRTGQGLLITALMRLHLGRGT